MELALAVFVMLRSPFGCSVEVTDEELFALLGSVTPFGAATLAVLVIGVLAPAGMLAATVNVAVPALVRLTVVLIFPAPLDAPQLEPPEAAQVQFTLVSTLGTLSVTVAPFTGLG